MTKVGTYVLIAMIVFATITVARADYIVDGFGQVGELGCIPSYFFNGTNIPNLSSYVTYRTDEQNNTVAIYPDLYCAQNFDDDSAFGSTRRVVIHTETVNLTYAPVSSRSASGVDPQHQFVQNTNDFSTTTIIGYYGNFRPNTSNTTGYSLPIFNPHQMDVGFLPQAYDITENGVDAAFNFTLLSQYFDFGGIRLPQLSLYVYTSATQFSMVTVYPTAPYTGDIESYGGPTNANFYNHGQLFLIPFTEFTVPQGSSGPANFASVRAIQIVMFADANTINGIVSDIRTVPLPSTAPSLTASATSAPSISASPSSTPAPSTSPSVSLCPSYSASPSPSACPPPPPPPCDSQNDDNDGGVTINFYFADILRGM